MPAIQQKKPKRTVKPKVVEPPSSSSSSSSSSESDGEEEEEEWLTEDDDSTYVPSSRSSTPCPSPTKNKKNSTNNLFSEKVLQSLIKNKKKTNTLKSVIDSDAEEEEEEDDEFVSMFSDKVIKHLIKNNKNKNKHSIKSLIESEDDEECSDEEDEEEDTIASSSSEYKKPKKTTKKRKTKKIEVSSEDEEEDDEDNQAINIVYTIMGDEDEDEDAEILEDDENEECNSEDEQRFIGETYEKVEDYPEPLIKKKKDKKTKPVAKPPSSEDVDFSVQYNQSVELKRMLISQVIKNPENKQLRKALTECEESVKSLVRKSRHNNMKEYHKLVHNELQQTNELEYFKKNLSNSEQIEIMRELKSINDAIYSDKPQRLALLQSAMANKYKAVAMQRLNKLLEMDRTDNEYHKLKYWVDNFMRIPFGIYRSISVSLRDGTDVCNQFMVDAKSTLDDCVYGLNDAKMQIMQMLGQWVVNPGSVGSAIAIHGPPGTGKTSIVKDGISKILGREFAFIALGGCGDSSFLEGHSYTYEGSLWGKIVQILMDSKCMNPVIYFDELDKVSDTARGQEIIGVLTHLTDTSQNSEFHDKYFSEVSFDLSKCLFIFSYNDESMVNPILKDRMYRIQTKGYAAKEKITIARNYLLPRIREQVCFSEEDIVISDETLKYIIGADHLTKNECGVRNLKRCLEIIYTKLNLFRLLKPGSSVIASEEDYKDLEIKWPFTVTRKEVDMFIKNKEPLNPTLLSMYI